MMNIWLGTSKFEGDHINIKFYQTILNMYLIFNFQREYKCIK